MLTNFFGALAALTSIITLIPQIAKSHRTKSCADLSLAMLYLFVTTSFCWIVYGVLTHTWAVWLTNILGGLSSLYLLGMKIYYDARAQYPL